MNTPLAAIDLNLMVALDALLTEQSVTRAGQRIGLSQPATSHALSRLREHFGDELLVRTPSGMRPTARGAELAPRVRQALEAARACLFAQSEFDPATTERSFTIAMSDYGTAVLLPRIAAWVRREAPGARVRVRPLPPTVSIDALAEGSLDLIVGSYESIPDGVERIDLFHDSFACLVPAHLDIGDWSAERYAQMEHVLVTSPKEGRGVVDKRLEELGLARRVAITVPHFAAAPAVVAASEDLVVTMPTQLARTHAERLPLRELAPPVELPTIPVVLIWHRRSQDDGGHRWLRDGFVTLTANLGSNAAA